MTIRTQYNDNDSDSDADKADKADTRRSVSKTQTHKWKAEKVFLVGKQRKAELKFTTG